MGFSKLCFPPLKRWAIFDRPCGTKIQQTQWQEGYGAFSIGISGVEDTTKYIEGQAEHHRKMTFKEEVEMFLKKHGMEYVERDLE